MRTFVYRNCSRRAHGRRTEALVRQQQGTGEEVGVGGHAQRRKASRPLLP